MKQLSDLIDLDSAISKNIISDAKFEYTLNGAVLSVKSEQFSKEYVLVKVPQKEYEQVSCNGVLYPEFFVQSKHGEYFGGFYLKGYQPAKQNDLKQLQDVLSTLAKVQAALVVKYDKARDQASLKVDHLDLNNSEEALKKLQADLDGLLLETPWLVPSLWTPLSNNSYINHGDGAFLQLETQAALVPPVLDALLYLFSLSDELFRQKHFKSLMQHYFDSLELELSESYKELQVRILLPVAKVKLAASGQASAELQENLSNYFRYPLINQEEVYEVVSKKLESDEFTLINYELRPLSEKNGHLGEYYFLKVNIKDRPLLDFFCKFLLATTDFLKEIIENRAVGKKENFFYGTLYPQYEKLGLGHLLDFAPKCYLHGISGFMVLDNLASRGFTSPKPNTTLNLDGLQAILSKLAKYHACSIILDEHLAAEQVSLYDRYEEYLKETLLLYEGSMATMVDKNLDAMLCILEKYPDLLKELDMPPEELEDALKDLIYSIFSIGKKSDHFRNCINHGDLYVGNTLIKYGENKQVVEGMLIDFQVVRYIPPAYEVLFFIYLTSSKETRNNHLQLLLDFYYDNLASHLEAFNLDLNKFYSKEDFRKNVEETKPMAISMAFGYGNMIHIDPDLREEIMADQEQFNRYFEEDRRALVDLGWEDEHYRNVMRGLIEDAVEVVKSGFRWDRSQLVK